MPTNQDRRALVELAERCEASDGTDLADLTAAIGAALGWNAIEVPPTYGHPIGHAPDGSHYGPLPGWLTSLDAAMTLVPEGWSFALTSWLGDASVFQVERGQVTNPHTGHAIVLPRYWRVHRC